MLRQLSALIALSRRCMISLSPLPLAASRLVGIDVDGNLYYDDGICCLAQATFLALTVIKLISAFNL